MRIIKSLVAGAAVAATATAMAVAPASAEPINSHGRPVTPAAYDIVGVGSESIFAVTDQLTYNYNLSVGKKHSPTDPYIYSWDAVPPNNMNDTTQQIVVKQHCTKNLRPNGSSAGILALVGGYGNTSYTYKGKKHTVPCIDFARSSRPRKGSDPSFAPGGVAFVILGGDAVTYASTNLKGESTNVPNNLSKAQLTEIFGCTVPAAHGFLANTWGALLGAGAKGASQAIAPVLPQAGSGTLSFWATTALGLTSTAEPTCGPAAGLTMASQQPEENEGTNNIFRIGDKKTGKPNPNVIYPFSVGSYVAQEAHSKACGKSPKKGQNMFGCNEIGVLGLNGISGVVPTVKVKGVPVTNPKWNSTVFHRYLYDVVRFNTTANPIPGYLTKWIGKGGYFCKQGKVLQAYGFETTNFCGAVS